MILKKTILGAALLLFLPLYGQQPAKEKGLSAINEEAVRGQLEFLASDWTEGRETGTPGAYLAADYIASMFKFYGLKPGGDLKPIRFSRNMSIEERQGIIPEREYFQNFELMEYRTGDVQECELIDRHGNASKALKLLYNVDFSVNPGLAGATITAPVVFVGYGINDGEYNEYKNVDVKGKVVLRMRGFPGHRNMESKAYKQFTGKSEGGRMSIERQKDNAAAMAGAIAVIEIDPAGQVIQMRPENINLRYNSPTWEGTEPLRNTLRTRLTRIQPFSLSITNVALSPRAMDYLLSNTGLDIESFENDAETKIKPASMALQGKEIYLNTSVESRIVQARNVIGILEGKKKDQCIVLGAHYDHVGMTRHFIYNGSDDNASGTVGIMSIARAFMESGQQPEYTMVFCAWTAEEKGLIGSAYFADNPVIKDIKCYMNYDMISRVALDDPEKNKCDFTFTNTVPALKELTEKHVLQYDINLDIEYKGSEVPVGGSDFSSFSRKGVPIFLLHGKFTPDYHQYTDHSDKAEIPYMTDIIRLGYLNLFELANNYQW